MGMNQRNDALPDGSDPRLSGLYRAVPAENPPEHLDAAVQAAARRAVGARPQVAGASLLRAWRVPLSIAAVLVMSVSMVTLTVRHKGDQLAQPPLTAAAPGPHSEPARAPVPPAVTDAAAVARQAAPVAKPAVTGIGRKSASADMAEGARPPAPAAPEAEMPAPAMRRERAAAGTSGPAADAAPPAPALVRELEMQPPEKWLEKILGLRQQGRTKEADELFVEFKKRYPSHSLPSSLR